MFERMRSLFSDAAQLTPEEEVTRRFKDYDDTMAKWALDLETRLLPHQNTEISVEDTKTMKKKLARKLPDWPTVMTSGSSSAPMMDHADLARVAAFCALPGYKALKAAADRAELVLRSRLVGGYSVFNDMLDSYDFYTPKFTLSTPSGKSFKEHFEELRQKTVLQNQTASPPQPAGKLQL